MNSIVKPSQPLDQAIDVADWQREEEYAPFPVGARDKALMFYSSSNTLQYAFLKKDSRYLFKQSSQRYAEQFWVEILAYYIGEKMDIPIPQTFVAYDSKNKQAGALIEWFINDDEIYTSGGDYCQRYINDFNRKEGTQHNFGTISQIFTDLSVEYNNFYIDEFKNYWAKAFLFDSLIGNTDRHQDNWGIIENTKKSEIRISPVFDNGTSLGHEIIPKKFELFKSHNYIKKYVLKGKHHMKWELNDQSRLGHVELLEKFIERYSEAREVMLKDLKKVSPEIFKSILDNLVVFNVPARLTEERAQFILRLLCFRYERLLYELEKL